MAVGDLIVADYQYEFNGLLMGAKSPFRLAKIDGLLGMPDVKSSDLDRQDAWGDFPGKDLYGPRTVTYDVWLNATPGLAIEQAQDLLVEAHTIMDIPIQWVFQRPDGRGKRFIWARPRKADFTGSYETSMGICVGSAMVKAHDPRIYSLVETADPIALGIGVFTNNIVVNNNGKIDMSPIIELIGPMTNPRIANAADANKTIRLDVVIAAGQTYIVDVRSRTVTLNGADMYRATVRADNQWWKLKPGANAVTATRADNAAAATVRVRHRDGWIS